MEQVKVDIQEILFILYTLPPLVLGLLLVRFVALPLRYYQALFLLLGAAWVGLHYVFMPWVGLLIPLLIMGVGELVHLLFVGLYGSKIGAANSASLLMAVGLFPWYWGTTSSVVYIFLAFLAISAVSWVHMRRAGRAYDVLNQKFEVVQKRLSKKDLEGYRTLASTLIALPLLTAALLTAGLTRGAFF